MSIAYAKGSAPQDLDAAKGGLVKAYLSYAASKGQSAADGLGYAALPADLVTKVQASLEAVS